MIQRWEKACKVFEHINEIIETSQRNGGNAPFPQIQKVWSSLALVSLGIRFVGKTKILNLSKSPKFFAVFVADEKAPGEWRAKDKTQDWLRSKLSGRRLKRIEFLEQARVFTLVLDHPEGEDFLSVFYTLEDVAHLYYDCGEKKLWRSWAPPIKDEFNSTQVSELFEHKDEVRFFGGNGVDKDFSYEDIESVVSSPAKVMRRIKKSLARKQGKIQSDLLKNEALISIEDGLIENTISLDGLEKLEVNRQKIKLPADKGHFAKRDYLFNKIKGAKKGIEITKERLEKVKGQESELTPELLSSPYQWEFLGPKAKKAKRQEESGRESQGEGYELFKIAGVKAGIGKTAQGNDALRKEFNKKKAIWFHIEAGSSAHVIVGTDNFADLSAEDLEVIGSMIRDSMGETLREVHLIYTLLKNVKALKGTAGKVIYSNIKYIKVNYLVNWKSLIS